ncbi:MAG TPA: hypothetical protein DEB17_01590 [Chlorobaculum sp.]|uniref:Uncharacterized protein n=2 Tax=Chlorobiaceae TaxID=191412 RepID=Q8KDD3_CHLTE|nr:hypothetical protein CT1121 [Chlorobaculum tepidum TLS]HBU22691.1 hypothetical protein [Chlorobaculum sp.]
MSNRNLTTDPRWKSILRPATTCNHQNISDMAMTVEIRDNKLCIEIDLEKPTPSSSGKTLVVASTHGNAVTDVMIEGKPVTIGLNAYIKK